MDIIIQILFNAMFLGSVYFMYAIGFSIIYGMLRIIHFAHVDIAVLGVFIFIYFSNSHLGFVLSFLLTLLLIAIIGVLIFHLIYKPFYNSYNIPNLVPLIISIGFSIIIQHLLLITFGDIPYTIDLNENFNSIYVIADASIKLIQLFCIGTAILVLVFSLFFFKTKAGLAIKAISEDVELSKSIGIKPIIIIAIVFLLLTPIAFLGAFYSSLDTGVFVRISTELTIKSFIISIIGGVGSVKGAFWAALALSLAEGIIGVYVSAGFKEILIFILLLIVLMYRPQGFFIQNKT